MAVAAAGVPAMMGAAEPAMTLEQPSAHSYGVGATFDADIPSGSQGLWKTGSGTTISFDYAYRFNPTWSLQSGIGVYYRTYGTDYPGKDVFRTQGTVKNVGLTIPVMAAYTAPVSTGIDFTAATGPALNINMYAHQSMAPEFTPDGMPWVPTGVNLFDNGFKHVDAVWKIALGFTFASHYYVGLSGSVGFTPLASFGNHDNKVRVRGNTCAVKLAYIF